MTMRKTLLTAFGLFVAFASRVVVSEKDNNYYPPGYSNPNVNTKCTGAIRWSPYAPGCGETNDDSYSLWYMGYTHCFRANAAYSLYGVLKGNDDNGCTSGTYINSFFTNYGVDTFVPVMEAAGIFSEDDEDSYSADCEDGDGNDADGGGYGGGTSYANKGDNRGSTSYGMSCDGNQFVTKKFRGRYCDGKDEIEVTNLLESFNEAIEQVECVQVYSGSNNNNGDDEIASELLSSSKACSLREYPTQCPDPHGKLLKYTRALECATDYTCLLNLPEARLGRDIASVVLLVGGLAMIGAALFCKWRRKRSKSHMDFVRESSDLSNLSKTKTSGVSRVASKVPLEIS